MIKIFGDIKHPPFEFINKKGEPDGFSIDITKAIAKKLDLEIDITLMDWTRGLDKFINGEFDMVQGMSNSGNRADIYNLGPEYITIYHSVFTLKDNSHIRSINDVYKYKVAVQENDVGKDLAMKMGSNSITMDIVILPSQEDALKLLFDGMVDIVIGNKQTVLYYAEEMDRLKDIKLVGNPLNLTKYGLAFKKEDENLYNLFSEGMQAIKRDETYENIYNKWFGQEVGYFGKQILDNVEIGVIYIDRLGGVVTLNNYAENLLNIDKKDIQFKLFYETKLIEVFNTTAIQRILDGAQKVYYGTMSLTEEGKSKYFEVSYTGLFDDDLKLKGVLINFKDQTEEMNLKEALVLKDKMDALGALLINIAHEIRNPLTSLNNFVGLLPKYIEDNEFIEAFMYHVPNEIKHMDNLLTELLEYAKPREASFRDVNISDIFNETLITSIYLKKNIKLNINIEENFTLYCDYNQIRQVLINLLLNSVEAIDDKGYINIYSYENKYIKKIVIEDSGKNIREGDLHKVFDPFFTTKEEGSGLGLFISYNLINQNNGSIKINNHKEGIRVSLIFEK